MRRGNRHSEAFKEGFNVVGLATAAALSAATLNPLPLLVGLVAEAAYLLFVPDSKWYEARLSRRHDAAVERRRQEIKEQILPTLRPAIQDRFVRLEETRRQIEAQGVEEQTWFREVLRKLDFLLEKFLQFASKEEQFRSYLQSLLQEMRGTSPRRGEDRSRRIEVEFEDDRPPRRGRSHERQEERSRSHPEDSPEASRLDPADRWVQQTISEIQARYEAETEDVRGLLDQEQDGSTRGVLQKRIDVLQRRHEFVGRIGKILTNLNHQLQLLEDSFGLINDEIRARSPEQILHDIEEVEWQTNTMTTLLDEMAPYEQMVARLKT
jgi:hypothetical protein